MATYADSFNRANAGSWGTSSDGLWTWTPGAGNSIDSDQGRLISPVTASYGYTDAQAQTDTDSMYAEIDLVAYSNAGGSFIFFVAISHPNDDSSNYAWGYDGTDLIISGSVSGDLGRVAIASPVGKRVRIARIHPAGFLGVYIDGVLTLSATDSASPSGSGYRGVQVAVYADNTSSFVTVDNFTYGDIKPSGRMSLLGVGW
jgi:hypothetical protein